MSMITSKEFKSLTSMLTSPTTMMCYLLLEIIIDILPITCEIPSKISMCFQGMARPNQWSRFHQAAPPLLLQVQHRSHSHCPGTKRRFSLWFLLRQLLWQESLRQAFGNLPSTTLFKYVHWHLELLRSVTAF